MLTKHNIHQSIYHNFKQSTTSKHVCDRWQADQPLNTGRVFLHYLLLYFSHLDGLFSGWCFPEMKIWLKALRTTLSLLAKIKVKEWIGHFLKDVKLNNELNSVLQKRNIWRIIIVYLWYFYLLPFFCNYFIKILLSFSPFLSLSLHQFF